jgi:hypothetical protein
MRDSWSGDGLPIEQTKYLKRGLYYGGKIVDEFRFDPSSISRGNNIAKNID